MNQDYQKKDKEIYFQGKTFDEIDELGTDLKINPDYYIHKAIVKAQDCFDGVGLKEGMAKFRIFINQLEIISKACGNVHKDYNDKVRHYVESEDFKRITDEEYKGFKIAEYKFKLIMEDITKNRGIVDSLSI